MSRLEEFVRQALVEQGDQAPDDTTLLVVVRRRALRRYRRRRFAAVLGIAVLVLAAGAITNRAFVTGDGDPAATASYDATKPVALVTNGSCAGLSVTAVKPPTTAGGPTTPLAHIQPGGGGNLVTMPGNSMILLQAEGPCAAQLRFHPDGIFLQGPGPSGDWNFTDGIGLVVSHDQIGRTRIDLYLDCIEPAECGPRNTPLAVITVDVTAPSVAPMTHLPRAS
ncbi:hypothetical protein ABT369_04840 [Dactylosporangium sp. NPDC000244]|uniref:hypothetical protein n=1 Tax=Dactylosporangium sp. NPDC000244 TaxID=3154365 RepID=UPI0033302FB0